MKICLSCQHEWEDPALLRCPSDDEPLYPVLRDYTDNPDELIGHIVDGRYRIEERLGAGGMGIVVRATHLFLNRDVAIKLLHPELLLVKSQRERFIREAQALSQIDHPRVVTVSDFGVTSQRLYYLVMEFLSGCELRKILDDKPMDAATVARIGAQVCEGLSAIHDQGLVHRDLKPENCWVLNPDAPADQLDIKVIDLGLVSASEEDGPRLTESGRLLGTPRYMAPEHVRQETLDGRTDLYALGCLLWELLVGSPYIQANSAAECFTQQLLQPPRRASSLREGLPQALDDAIFACLQKEAVDRPQSAEDMRALVLQVLDEAPLLQAGDEASKTPRAETPIAKLPRAADPASSATRSAALLKTMSTGPSLPADPATQVPPKRKSALFPFIGVILLALTLLITMPWSSEVPTRPDPDAGPTINVVDPTPVTPPSAKPLARHDDIRTSAEQTHDAGAPQPSDALNEQLQETTTRTSKDPKLMGTAPPLDAASRTLSRWSVRIDTRPTGAKVIVNDTVLGPAPQTISWNNGTKAPKVSLKRRGFKTHHVTLSQSDDGASQVITLVRLRKDRKDRQNEHGGKSKPLKDRDKTKPTWELVPDDR